MLSGVSLVSILLIGALWISSEAKRSEQESAGIRRDYISTHEATINLETNRICDYIEAQRQAGEIRFLESLKTRVHDGYNFIEAVTASQNPRAGQKRIQEMVLIGLNGLTFNQGKNRFFVSTLSGQQLLNQEDKQAEPGGDLQLEAGLDYFNSDAFIEISESLTKIKEGFFRYNLTQNSRRSLEDSTPQMAYLKLYEPWGWIIGASEHQADWDKEIQSEMLEWASGMSLPSDQYLMILDYNGNVLVSPDERLKGINVFTSTGHGDLRKIASDIIRGAKELNKDFVRYGADPESGVQGERIAFFRAVPAWRWVVVSWVYFKDLDIVMAEREAALAHNVQNQITRIVAISISMLLLIMLLSKILSGLATRSFAAFFMFFERAASSSIEMNPAEQPFDEFRRLAEAANNMIAQRRLANSLLRESELKFKTIFDVSPQVITISDLDGNLLEANEEFNHFSNRPAVLASGQPLENSFSIEHETREQLWRELKNKKSLTGREIQAKRPDGSPLEFLVFGKMIHLQANSFILTIFTDISALKAAENEKLVLQEKLSRSTKMEAMGLMAAEVAHDLNNILSGIIGYPQLLLMEQNITEKQKETLKEILETGQRAAAVVSDLLTIARGVASTKGSIPVNNIVTAYTNSPECRQLQELFPKVRLDLKLEEQAGNLIASSVHLTKVVMNLVSNAFEAMPLDKSDGKLTVETGNITLSENVPGVESKVEPGEYVFLSVYDNGPGIPPEDVAKIFEPFYSKKTKGRSGTGLGLAIVWNTINDHNGYLTVSTSSAGTTFTLYFKRTYEKAAAAGKQARLEDYKGAGQRILVVDDVDIQRKLAAKMLKTLGYEPVTVPSGEAAVELLKQEDVDLVILDMIMHPGMNGRETYGCIMEFKPRQKAIIASGMAETDEVAKAQAMGAGQFINKPYTIEDLAVAVQKALQSN